MLRCRAARASSQICAFKARCARGKNVGNLRFSSMNVANSSRVTSVASASYQGCRCARCSRIASVHSVADRDMSAFTRGSTRSLSSFHQPRSAVSPTVSSWPDSIFFQHKSNRSVWVKASINHSFLVQYVALGGCRGGHRGCERLFADDVKSFWAPHKKGFRPHRIGIAQFDSLIPAKQHGDCDLRLQPRQMTTETRVRTGAKSEMSIVFSLDVESIRIGKLDWIAI